MSLIVSVYTRKYSQEFLLPPVHNADYALDIRKSRSGLKEDISIRLEEKEEKWRLCRDESYRIYAQVVEGEIYELDHGDAFRLVTAEKETISMLVREAESPFTGYAKFNISHLDTIQIGRDDRCEIRYDFQGMVSDRHAVLFRRDGQWRIENRGGNGSYLNSAWLDKPTVLSFGDYINVIGLHLVFLGSYLAVDLSSGNVRIDERRLGKAFSPAPRIAGVKEGEASGAKTENTGGQAGFEEVEKAPPGKVRVIFHRSPRNIEKIETEEVEIENPPAFQKSKRQPFFLTVGPSFTMAIPMLLGCLLMVYASRVSGSSMGLFMYSGLVMAVSSALIGVFWAISNMRYQRKAEKEEEAHRFDAYGKYLVEKTDEIRTSYEKNALAMHAMYPDASTVAAYNEQTTELWNRNDSHEDFLYCRMGLGDVPFQVSVNTAKKKFTLHPDPLDEKPQIIKENFKTLYKVPILLDVRHHPLIGIVGGEGKTGAAEVARILAVQIAATHCYTDVKMAFLYNGASSDDDSIWEFSRWLPHVWAEDRKIRYIASDKASVSDVCYELTKLFRQRLEERIEKPDNTGSIKPHVVLFISDLSLIEDELLAKYIFDKDENLGLSVLILSDTVEHLPNACDYIIQNDSVYRGMYHISAQKEERVEIAFDELAFEAPQQLARTLANIEVQEVEMGGEIPASLTFFEMYGVSGPQQLGAAERWLKNRTYSNIRGLIGQKAGGADCYLDVHEKYHGPHGLVAGTTGSGKSETLQTYMLSLALSYSPDDVAFFIIDYKGGGMANLFRGLPHLAGQISNLSGNQVHRAMVSIKSENRRRQRIFSENGVNNINAYTRLFKNREAFRPVPHLFIIIDEFAELKKEEPDFMQELISVAQVGRSLGVHLILATQKPAGTVDDNIWSNSRFRLCLRVQDKEDSMDMLHKPDAAYITQAGRCYLQVGSDEVYELFQSGWSGAPYEESMETGALELAKLITVTGRTETVGGHIRTAMKNEAEKRWLAKLCRCIRKTADETGRKIAELADPDDLPQDFIRRLFDVVAQEGIEYPPGRYNRECLVNLISLYAKAQAEDSSIFGSMLFARKEEEADAVIGSIMEKAASSGIKLPAPKEKTQLDAVVEYLAVLSKKGGYVLDHQLWMPVLPERLFLEEFSEFMEDAFTGKGWREQKGAWDLDTIIGKLDDPANQTQLPLHVSFSEGGHLALIGSIVSGKSTFLQTLLYAMLMKYTPEELNIYGIDYSSKMMAAFEKAPHTGGIAFEGEDERIAKLFHMMEEILAERKKLMRGGNYSQYVQVHGVTLPAILLVIDNVSAFREKTEEKYDQMLITLSKEGVSHGIFLVVTAGGFSMSELPGRIAENMKTVIALEMPDKYAYADVLHTMRIDVLPEIGVKGRGLAFSEEGQLLEFQTALAMEAEDDYQRMERIGEISERMAAVWTGKRARPIPQIPEKPVWAQFAQLDDVIDAAGTGCFLPVGYDEASAGVYSIPLRDIYCYLIAGYARTGKRNFMRIMILSSRMMDSEIYVIDSAGDMNMLTRFEDLHFIREMDELFDFFMNTLTPIFQARNKIKKELENQGAEDDEIFEAAAKEKPVFVYIPDLARFISSVYADERNMSGFLETLFMKGRFHHIYFIGCLSLENKAEVMSYQLMSDFAGYQTGIHFGGNTSANSFMNFDHLGYQVQSAVLRPGIGLLPSIAGEHDVERVIVPLAKVSLMTV